MSCIERHRFQRGMQSGRVIFPSFFPGNGRGGGGGGVVVCGILGERYYCEHWCSHSAGAGRRSPIMSGVERQKMPAVHAI